MATSRNTPCPTCDGKEKTEFVALQPYKEVPPHRYSVGKNCYRKQFKEVYGEDAKCPV